MSLIYGSRNEHISACGFSFYDLWLWLFLKHHLNIWWAQVTSLINPTTTNTMTEHLTFKFFFLFFFITLYRINGNKWRKVCLCRRLNNKAVQSASCYTVMPYVSCKKDHKLCFTTVCWQQQTCNERRCCCFQFNSCVVFCRRTVSLSPGQDLTWPASKHELWKWAMSMLLMGRRCGSPMEGKLTGVCSQSLLMYCIR